MKKHFLFTAVLFAALSLGFASCDNVNEELLERIEQLENELNDLKNDKDKTDSADKDGDKDNSSDNEQNGEGTPEPGEGDDEEETPTPNPYNGYEWVDLGLPSGLRWATCNVGATKPEEYGNYYAWGEVEPKEVYDWSTYKWMTSGMSSWTGINKYTYADGQNEDYDVVWYDNSGNFIGDNKTVLDPEDDAVAVNWGGNWRMPTKAEQDELRTECSWTWTTLNDVNGYNVEGPNGNAIFLPAAGFRRGSGLIAAGSGYYWSSSLYTDHSYGAYRLDFLSDCVYWDYSTRDYGRSVRGVFSK